MISSPSLWKVAAGAGVALLGYCIYFDRKRRNDPLFKEKLRERRKQAKETRSAKKTDSGPILNKPTPNDPESYQRFFLQEVQLGEELLASGDIHTGVEHLSNALAVCTQPQQLMQILQQSLPPAVCQLLTSQIPVASKRIFGSLSDSDSGEPFALRPAMIPDDDLE